MQARRHHGAMGAFPAPAIHVHMLGSLSLVPGLAVAGVTTSVSLAAAMGGVQSLPTEPAKPPVIRTVSAPVQESMILGATALRIEQPVDEPDLAAATPQPTAAPSSAPATATAAPAVTVASKPAATATPKPAPKPAATAAPTPAPQCVTWSYQGWTVNWCTTTTSSTATWSVTNGTTTYSGTYNMTTRAITGTYPSGWSSNWESSGGKYHQ